MTAGAGAAAVGLLGRPALAGGLPPASVRTRRRFFGEANVDGLGRVRPDRVVLSWFGVTGFALAFGGQVFLLDAWVPRGEYSGYVPTSPDELATLRPSHVFLGHGHFDHAADAAYIAVQSGALVLGTPEHCAQVTEQSEGRARVQAIGPPAAEPGPLAELWPAPQVQVSVVKHVHSAAKAPDGSDAPLVTTPDLTPCLEHPPTVQDGLHELSHLPDQEGGSLAYRFRQDGFTLVWHDTSGPLATDAPAAFEALQGMRSPDVQLGSIQGFGQYTNGMRDPMQYVEALRPRVFVPGHHDNWAPPASAPGSSYEGPLREELARFGPDAPTLVMLRDPDDYVRPGRLTFRV